MPLMTVHVPAGFEAIFEQAERAVGSYFDAMRKSPASGTIEIFDSRYILLRGASLSIEFFQLVRKIYGPDAREEADRFSGALLYDLAHAIGRSDARNFHDRMQLDDPIEKLSAGPVHFSHSGWAFVEIDAESMASPDDNFVLHYTHPFSFEADAWLDTGEQADFPVCVMNAGYSAGWCQESFGIPLEAREISCRGAGHEECRFVMAPPEQLPVRLGNYLDAHPEVAERHRAFSHADAQADVVHTDSLHISNKPAQLSLGMEERLLTYARKLEAAQTALKIKIAQLEHEIGERRIAEHELKRLVGQDDLTGLGNRNFFMTHLQSTLQARERRPVEGKDALLFLDLDHFKSINDSLGHDVGDRLLRQVGHLLRSHVEVQDVVARLGGDEFAVWIENLPADHVAGIIAKRLLDALSRPIDLGDHEIRITPSIGIALYPDNGRTAGGLLRNADLAMYHAKSSGRNNFQYFTNSMNRRVQERLTLERELRLALENDHIQVYYQPRLRTRDGSLMGMEALARWPHAERGMIPPAQFIPVAEETGMIELLGNRVLEQAGQQFQHWLDAGLEPGRLAVNLSPRQLRHQDLVAQIQGAARDSGLPLNRLELEITESAIMEDVDAAIAILLQLRELGIHLSIDDFGTGYSSLSCLQSLPVDTLKIDRSFVNGIRVEDCAETRLVKSVIELGHIFGLNVVAEGVETETQLEVLVSLGCEEAQGYYLGHPVAAEHMGKLLRERRHTA